ncbi:MULTISPECIES: type VI secretion system baseplate subunit TssG [Pseudomonas]|jgi:type VI secretion system protein ImpH|uniref:Type VI secretion protein n=2 Tax=Pseudomonas marincola TaxID=437900 RepID=A0A653DYJ5_9PSED|nr:MULTISPECIES: type VI secretion system baseplate subunit TssG [Pseudomonas]MAB99125.1 type VI secretion system baseplate subunit TssG [Pseudomonadaceae bacterium]HCP53522.1 type VI secretion system baseplate subunit TssG [Pseudomonas sp.]MBQ56443.1 type VI secretion system baseplate subunit TssG [Pseudomonadaceae bacterium]OEO26835.1 type VI secretion protein [Pseudomonas sp. J237]CAE6936752.1 Type VI secretion system baseplate subunit TssG [Pseudomonas marincola]|tara:strand:+ start:187 stop:1194 length:1008 start_codon:yes stop_codon:yes gene_type:complete
MDATHGVTAPALSGLSQVIREYSLFQAVQRVLYRLREAHPFMSEEELYDQLEFQANPSLGFPGSDVDRVEFFQEEGLLRCRLRFNLIGLFGASSPIPAFYGEQALGDSPEGNPTREFLDLFNHRLQRLLLPIWRKYRYRSSFRTGANDPFSEQLFALVGLAGQDIRNAQELNWKRLLPYLGLLSLRAHSAALIEAVLRYYFKHADMNIEQCVVRIVDIQPRQQNSLGTANYTLAHDLVLGERVRDCSGKFRIHIRRLSWVQFHHFLPIGTGYQPLCALVRFTLRDPLDYDIRLVLIPEEIRELRIGQESACLLGWTSWLGCERADGVVTLGSKTH